MRSSLNLHHIIPIYISWYPSEYHLRTKFDHSHCQNIISQSQNRCSIWTALVLHLGASQTEVSCELYLISFLALCHTPAVSELLHSNVKVMWNSQCANLCLLIIGCGIICRPHPLFISSHQQALLPLQPMIQSTSTHPMGSHLVCLFGHHSPNTDLTPIPPLSHTFGHFVAHIFWLEMRNFFKLQFWLCSLFNVHL